MGHLYAIKNKASIIQETDDDNIPYNSFWKLPSEPMLLLNSDNKWINVYSLFSKEKIWPRGFPLNEINADNNYSFEKTKTNTLIFQGLADKNPDVDAIYRLTGALPIKFDKVKSFSLKAGNWSPFNSQNTIFKKEAFPLIYLPATCSFRMTDIWRS